MRVTLKRLVVERFYTNKLAFSVLNQQELLVKRCEKDLISHQLPIYRYFRGE